MTAVLIPLSEVLDRLPVRKSRPTIVRWIRKHQGLGLAIGSQWYMHPAAAQAIGEGKPLADAAVIGAAGLAALARGRAAA
jgi:hypothetical protein